MALHKKLQEVFNWYIDTNEIKKKDFYQFSQDVEKKLKNSGFSISSAQFITKIFDALEYPSSAWKPKTDDLLVFFDSLPERMWKDRWDIMVDYVPKEEWGRYNKEWSKTTSSFINSLDSEPVMLIEEDKEKNLIFSVFLGDITSKLGISEKDLKYRYNNVYDAIENELGYKSIKNHLPANIEVLDWPNASVVTNAKYEFRIRAQKDPPIADVKNIIIMALNKVGV